MDQRYKGKPFLRLLECYVLWSINELENKDRLNLEKMSPKLREIYNIDGDWIDIIEKVMEFPNNIQSLIKNNWEKNLKIAEIKNIKLSPERFAQDFVDGNFI